MTVPIGKSAHASTKSHVTPRQGPQIVAKKKSPKETNPSFEEAMDQLEKIVRRLEDGGGALDEALDDYSSAIELMKICHTKLADVERRIEVLSGVDAEGNPITKPLEERTESLDEKRNRRSSRRSANTSEPGERSELF